ncbi:MAG: hypothetical protein ACOYLS_15310 [Polymorphobacter sp.]
MRPICNHIQAALLRAIVAELAFAATDREKTVMVVEAVHSRDWASATFVGATHIIDIRIEGETDAVARAATRLVAGLPDREIAISGHILAEIVAHEKSAIDLSVTMIAKLLTVNALTIID